MNINEFGKTCRTGDVLLVEGNLFVRVFTAQTASHVAIVYTQGSGLRVAEFVEGTGFRDSHWLDWFKLNKNRQVFFGSAPSDVYRNSSTIVELIEHYKANKTEQSYGYLSLFKVWFSQLIGKKINVRKKVCSTFVQECWEKSGFSGFNDTADPGDFFDYCDEICAIKETKK